MKQINNQTDTYMKNKFTIIITLICALTFVAQAQETATDIDGNTYETITLPNGEVWFLENLKVTKNPQGESIAWSCYNDDVANCAKWGGMYSYTVAVNGKDYSSTQGICPDGWHIPSLEEVKMDATSAGAVLGDDLNAGNWADFKSYVSLQYGGKKTVNGEYVNADGLDTQWSGAFLYTSTRPMGWTAPYGFYMANPDMGGAGDASGGGTTLDPPTTEYCIRCKKSIRLGLKLEDFSGGGFTLNTTDTVTLDIFNILLREMESKDTIDITEVVATSGKEYQIRVALNTEVVYEVIVQKPKYYIPATSLPQTEVLGSAPVAAISKVYPTLVSDHLIIETKNIAQYFIYGIDGSLVKKGIPSEEKSVVDVSSFRAGQYVVLVVDKNGQQFRAKFIKK